MKANTLSRSIVMRTFVGVMAGILLFFSWTVIRWGSAGLLLNSAESGIGQWETTRRATGQHPTKLAWQQVHDDLLAAQQQAPQSPQVLETLGLLHLQPTNVDSGTQTSPDLALAYFQQAAVARPVSAYTWANIVAAKYDAGQIDDELYQAMRHAIKLGAWEPEVQFVVTDIGFALWDEMPIALRKPVSQTAENGTRRYAAEIMQIASKRGRLSILCSFEKMAAETACQKIHS